MKGSIASLQSVVSLMAGIASLSGAVYSAVRFVNPAAHSGDLVAVVRAAGTEKAVPGATVEVLTVDDAVVATLSGDREGTARQPLPEGAYRLRALAPQHDAQTRDIRVKADATTEVRFALAPRDRAADGARSRGGAPARAVSRSVGAAQRFLHRLGL